MSSHGNLSGYHIPHLATGATPKEAMDPPLRAPTPPPPVIVADNPRLLAPGKQNQTSGGESTANPRPPKRKANGEPTPTGVKDGNEAQVLSMFTGRDKSYPDELNRLIGPLSCELCKAQMSSLKCARDHYESKGHDRHISAWLTRNYTDAGLQAPPVKRLVKEGPSGPNAFHCDLCDLNLTSAVHARQHYMGRKHKLVEQKITRPSGAGYYDGAGKWVRTGTKFDPRVGSDARYGIGTLFLKSEAGKAETETTAEATEVKGETSPAGAPEGGAPEPAENRSCNLCKIVVTSDKQMQLHLDGARHLNSLRNAGLEPAVSPSSGPTTENDIDLLLYRTPTGQYYCKPCNTPMNHVTTLQQHLTGKKHLKMVKNTQQAEKTG